MGGTETDSGRIVGLCWRIPISSTDITEDIPVSSPTHPGRVSFRLIRRRELSGHVFYLSIKKNERDTKGGKPIFLKFCLNNIADAFQSRSSRGNNLHLCI